MGSLSLAIQEFHGLSDTDLGSVVRNEHWILLLQNLEDFGYGHPSSFFLILGCTEAGFQPALLRRSHVGKLINIYKKVVGECHLGIKLVVEVDVDEEMFLEKKQLYGMTKWSPKLCQNFSLLCRKMMKSIWGYSFLG